MSLVSYDYGSNSENEDEDPLKEISVTTSTPISITNNTITTRVISKNVDLQGDEENSNGFPSIGSNMFSSLPRTHGDKTFEEGQIEDFIPKTTNVEKVRQKVKITIPSLSQFTDEENESFPKKFKPSMKGSGLISLLPPVKGSVITAKSFIPNVVANKNKPVAPSSSVQNHGLIPDVIKKKANTQKAIMLEKIQEGKGKTVISDVESDDDVEMPEIFDDEMWEKVCGRPKPKPVIREPQESFSQVIDIAPEPEKQYDGLDNKAFKELVGKSKRPIGNIKLIDINEEEILLDKDLWMVKSLTDPELAPKPEVEEPVDPTRRKKHHITYLVQQAKANEQELQNAWSASRNNKMATRAKYGF